MLGFEALAVLPISTLPEGNVFVDNYTYPSNPIDLQEIDTTVAIQDEADIIAL